MGEIYESLRGLRLEIKSGNEPVLIPHAGGRRNQGLFYTPRRIVEQIVSGALDALEISEPEDYLDLKILDPAVGTGVFLAQALEEVTRRVLEPSSKRRGVVSPKLEKIRNKISSVPSVNGIDTEPNLESAIRIHVMTSCLYGVDLDPTAAHIARAVLRKHVFGNLPAPGCFSPNIRAGNSLMGSARTNRPACCSATGRRPKMKIHVQRRSNSSPMWRQRPGLIGCTLEHTLVEKPCTMKMSANGARKGPSFTGRWNFRKYSRRDRDGFDIIIGNPPYEIISVKESGIRERTKEQAYFRRIYRSCHGKINTYRLMMERGLWICWVNPGSWASSSPRLC